MKVQGFRGRGSTEAPPCNSIDILLASLCRYLGHTGGAAMRLGLLLIGPRAEKVSPQDGQLRAFKGP